MTQITPLPVYLCDYTPPAWRIDTVHLDVDIRQEGTVVSATLHCARNPAVAGDSPLTLDGADLETLWVKVDGKPLSVGAFELGATQLTLSGLPKNVIVETRVRLQPDRNTQLSGLFRSHNGYFTQCEPQGFRRMTWFIDRPDVMASYTVTLHADQATFPVLLANGNPIASGDEPDGRHFATWQDPFKKPCYLFALVAGQLDVLRDRYRTASGRDVQLAIYVEPGKLDQCEHAMAALKKSMRWDEETFGLECDLDHYMIVAVGDFNMGAMENKGLNIFNTQYVLARADVATDVDFENIDRVVAHEYFHNWTGNRVTCRDWFQLSLKEGLTVFRDQEFGADLHNRETARIREVRGLRAAQFPEDAGPMAHPVRPSGYLEINNFYTATVYEKGAEVVRMIQTLIGKVAFRRGMKLYFARHDGQAVTCDDFVAAMADASGFDFSPFMAWYRQAGTPRVKAHGQYDAASQIYRLTLSQSGPPSVGQPDKVPVLIPVAVGLLDPQGNDFELGGGQTTRLLHLTQPEQSFVFENIAVAPIPSLLRNFSAPVILEQSLSEADLAHLLAYDSDPFNRWEAGQQLFGHLILSAAADITNEQPLNWPTHVVGAARRVLLNPNSGPAFIAEALTLPGEATLAEQMAVVDPEALHQARSGLARFLASALEDEFARRYAALAPSARYRPEPADAGRRRLRNLCLSYLNEFDKIYEERDPHPYRLAARRQFDSADNMTDQFAALSILANTAGDEGKAALADFYERWQHEALVVNKWLAVQASSRRPDTLHRVKRLLAHPAFDLRNPNKVYALLRTFGANHRHFHAADGSGYRFIARQAALLDAINPQVASRLARCFDRWTRFDPARQNHARAALQELGEQPGLSRDVFEIVEKALASANVFYT
jgi:aminopeptidase N